MTPVSPREGSPEPQNRARQRRSHAIVKTIGHKVCSDRAGVALIEVLMTAIISAIAILGLGLMLAKGSGWVAASGENRVAMRLAQQKIEHLRSIGFSCIPASGPPSSGTGILPAPVAGCTATQKYCEGISTCQGGAGWVNANGIAAPQPPPVPTTGVSSQVFMRKTCVQYVNVADFNNPAYVGGTNPTIANCPSASAAPDGTASVKRIVVVVQPSTPSGGSLQESEAPVVLQAWISSVPGGI